LEIDRTGPAAATTASPIVGLAALCSLDGVITLYAGLRVAPPRHGAFLTAVEALAAQLRPTKGCIHLALKQMSGASTMVKNSPEAYQRVLATA
jgi:hypothetical protein